MQRQSVTTSHKQADAQPVPEQQEPLPVALLSMLWSGVVYPLGQFRVAVPAVSVTIFAQTSLRTRGDRARHKEILDAVQTLFSNSQNTGVLPAVFYTNPRHSTLWAAREKVNVAPVRPSTAMHLKDMAYCIHFPGNYYMYYMFYFKCHRVFWKAFCPL